MSNFKLLLFDPGLVPFVNLAVAIGEENVLLI